MSWFDALLKRWHLLPAAGPAKPAGLVSADTTLNFGDATADGRRRWRAVFTFDDASGQAASNAQLAFSSGIPSITFSNVRAWLSPPAYACSNTAKQLALAWQTA